MRLCLDCKQTIAHFIDYCEHPTGILESAIDGIFKCIGVSDHAGHLQSEPQRGQRLAKIMQLSFAEFQIAIAAEGSQVSPSRLGRSVREIHATELSSPVFRTRHPHERRVFDSRNRVRFRLPMPIRLRGERRLVSCADR